MTESRTRIVVVDDDDFTRFLLARTIASFGFEDVDHYATAAEALVGATTGTRPAVAVCDLDLGPGPHGIDLAHALRKRIPDIGIVLLTSFDDPRLIGASRPLPVGGVYLSKRAVGDDGSLRRSLETVIAHPCAETNAEAAVHRVAVDLSDNQVEIMRLVAEGYSNAEIGRRRHLTERAVAKAVSRLVRQLGIEATEDDNVRVLIAQAYVEHAGGQVPRR